MKKCFKCKILKEITYFSRDKSKKDGLCPYCRNCDKQYAKEWRNKNIVYAKKRELRYREKNSEKIKKTYKTYSTKLRQIVIDHYGKKCVCCKEKEDVFLTIDHTNNDGKIFRKNEKRLIYLWIIKNNFPKDLQILCWNCNMVKRFGDVCPHQKK